jgi:hypothetical protein
MIIIFAVLFFGVAGIITILISAQTAAICYVLLGVVLLLAGHIATMRDPTMR